MIIYLKGVNIFCHQCSFWHMFSVKSSIEYGFWVHILQKKIISLVLLYKIDFPAF